jgi:hypothetical protein
MNRREAQLKIIDSLKRIDGRTSPWNPAYTFNVDVHENVLDHDEFIDNINSFPCVMVIITDTSIRHVGGGERLIISSFQVRGVTWDEDVEDAGELLADDIEHALSYVRQDNVEFDEVRLDTIQTDQGLNAPLGAVMIQGTMVYRNE